MPTRFLKMTGAAAIAAGLFVALPANAQNASQEAMKQCGEKWNAAKTANQTGGQTWPQFLAKCRTDLAKKPAATPAAATAAKPALAQPAATTAKPSATTAKPAAASTTKPAAASTTKPAAEATAKPAATTTKPAATTAKPAATTAKPAATTAKPAATTAKPATAQPAAATPPATPAKSTATAPKPAPGAAPAAAGKLVFPTKVDPKYASEKPGQQRQKTCVDQYNANKEAGAGNGGLVWIQKGGGYWSECNKRLGGGTAANSGT